MDITYLSQQELDRLPSETFECGFCSTTLKEEDVFYYEGYKLCEDCMEKTIEEDEENKPFEIAFDNGRSQRTREILAVLQGDQFKEAREIITTNFKIYNHGK